MFALYELIVKSKLGLNDDETVEVVTVSNNYDTSIRKTDNLDYNTGFLIIKRKNGRMVLINLEYVVKVYIRSRGL